MAAPELTMLARLAGPVQSWGAEPTLRTATTHSTPTWSGLLGLCRAALGHGRTDPDERIAWLRGLTMAVRVDAPGSVHVDFHTINPLPAAYERFVGVETRDRGLVPLGTSVQRAGQAPRWLNGEAPMITRRHLIHDASFLWLVGGPAGDVHRLADALAAPHWQLSLGRASCTPASPLLLGIYPGRLVEVAVHAPRSAASSSPAHDARQADTDGQVDLVWLHENTDSEQPEGTTPAATADRVRVVLDVPLGSHPQNGYAAGRHRVQRIPAPAAGDLLAWAAGHLTHPMRPTVDQHSGGGSSD